MNMVCGLFDVHVYGPVEVKIMHAGLAYLSEAAALWVHPPRQSHGWTEGGILFLSSVSGMHALDRSTGRSLWLRQCSAAIKACPAGVTGSCELFKWCWCERLRMPWDGLMLACNSSACGA